MDLATILKQFTLEEWYKLYKEFGVITWDSKLGEKPVITSNVTLVFKFLDNSNDVQRAIIHKRMELQKIKDIKKR